MTTTPKKKKNEPLQTKKNQKKKQESTSNKQQNGKIKNQPKKQALTTVSKKQQNKKRKQSSLKKKEKKSVLKKQSKKEKKGIKIIFFEILITLVLTSCVIYGLSFFTFSIAKVEGYSMGDTLEDKDVVLVNKFASSRRFDLVYIKVPNTKENSIRRLIAFPGESVYYQEGDLFINREKRVESFIANNRSEYEETGMLFTEDFTLDEVAGQTIIPKGKYLVLGDSRPTASDSRSYGLIDEKEIIGVVQMRLLPLYKMSNF